MCGVNGIFVYGGSADSSLFDELRATRDYMKTRGPDGSGEWWSENLLCGLGHRRLSIIDLSQQANQPMHSIDGNYVVTFNGEIYNYPELRRELELAEIAFKTNSDTEILLHLYALYGVDMLDRLRGMFAFAIWDANNQRLFLARDPYGIKPLYTADNGKVFRFASQVRALLAGGQVSTEIESAGVTGFYIWGSVPEPFTLYRQIKSLPAGHYQIVDREGPQRPYSYMSISNVLAIEVQQSCPSEALKNRVAESVFESIRSHLLADVEIGVFLSAGIDSGSILGLMTDAAQKPVKAITISFDDLRGTAEDEVPGASEIARTYAATHIIYRVSEREFINDLPEIIDAMDQPTIDGINIWFAAKAARSAGLKVALSGLGGDELFAGYPSFSQIPRLVSAWKTLTALPGFYSLSDRVVKRIGAWSGKPKLRGLLELGGSFPEAYLLRRAIFLPSELTGFLSPRFVKEGLERLNIYDSLMSTMPNGKVSSVANVAALESANYMRNQLLRDCDWAGMAHSLEIRTPLVDIELLRKISPVIGGMRDRIGKEALAVAPSKPLPISIMSRPKSGFVVPVRNWNKQKSSRTSKGLSSRDWAKQIIECFGVSPEI